MEPPRALLLAAVAAVALRLLFAFLAVSAGRHEQQQQPAMPSAVVVGALAPAVASRDGGAQETPLPLVVRKLAVPGAGTRPDDHAAHRAMPDDGAARHHAPAATNKWVIIGVVIAVAAVVLGALAVGVCCLCARRKRRRAARQPPPRAPSSPPWVPQAQGARGEVQGPQSTTVPHAYESNPPAMVPQAQGGRGEVAVDIPAGENNGCRLCRRPYGLDGDEAPHTLSCGDRFHRSCIRRWVRENLSCPVCNSSQIVLLGVGATTGAETSGRYSISTAGIQIRDDSVLCRSTFSF